MPIFAPAVRAAARPCKLGYVSPQTGPLAAFAEADNSSSTVPQDREGRPRHRRQQLCRSRSSSRTASPTRTAPPRSPSELIVDDEIDLMLVASTPETTNPVVDQCEVEEVPCISTMAPWQPWFIGRRAIPAIPARWKPFNYTYHYFWGLEDVIAVFTNMWEQLETNKTVGGLFPNDGDGNAWGDKHVGFPPVLDKQGFKLTDPGRYQNLTDDFSAQITAFKRAACEIVTGVVLPPDFTTFWNQAKPAGLQAEGRLDRQGDPVPGRGRGARRDRQQSVVRGLVVAEPSVQVVAHRPVGARARRRLHEQATEKAVDAADRLRPCAVRGRGRRAQARRPIRTMPRRVVAAIAATKLDTIVGPIEWNGRERAAIRRRRTSAKTPLVGGQWRLQGRLAIRHRHHRQQDRAGIPVAARWSRSSRYLLGAH